MRHTFKEFIDRYHMLSEGLERGQLDSQSLKNAAVRIAKNLLGNADWQVGKTKIFLKVSLFIWLAVFITSSFHVIVIVVALKSSPIGELES